MVKDTAGKILMFMLFISGIYWAFLDFNKYTWMGFVGSFIFGMIAYKFIKKSNLSQLYFLFIVLALWFNMLGEIYLYQFRGVDKFLHLITAFMITFIISDLLKKKEKQVPKIFIFLAVVGCLALFEIFDYILFQYFGLTEIMGVWKAGEMIVSPLTDTISDIAFGAFGSILACLWMSNFELKFKKQTIIKFN